jgi:hypothetical protein
MAVAQTKTTTGKTEAQRIYTAGGDLSGRDGA